MIKRKRADIWRNNNTERCCQRCLEWKPVHSNFWHVRSSGYPIFAKCRNCVNPSGRKPGRPFGSLDRSDRQRSAAGGYAANERHRIAAATFNPNALLDACKGYGIDPAMIALRMAEAECLTD